jgi:hypothetical protein
LNLTSTAAAAAAAAAVAPVAAAAPQEVRQILNPYFTTESILYKSIHSLYGSFWWTYPSRSLWVRAGRC